MGPGREPRQLTSVEQRSDQDPATGWRYWQLDPATNLLHSVSHRQIRWRPGQPLRAACLIGGHAAPAPGCACGVHAHRDLAGLRTETLCLVPTRPLVAGEVALWGTVVSDDHGIRAEYGYPGRLLLVTPSGPPVDEGALLDRLSAYGVVVGTVGAPEVLGEVAAAILAFQAMSR